MYPINILKLNQAIIFRRKNIYVENRLTYCSVWAEVREAEVKDDFICNLNQAHISWLKCGGMQEGFLVDQGVERISS